MINLQLKLSCSSLDEMKVIWALDTIVVEDALDVTTTKVSEIIRSVYLDKYVHEVSFSQLPDNVEHLIKLLTPQ